MWNCPSCKPCSSLCCVVLLFLLYGSLRLLFFFTPPTLYKKEDKRPKQMHVVKQLQSREIGASRSHITLHLSPFQQRCYAERMGIWFACEQEAKQTQYTLCPLVEGFTHNPQGPFFALVVQSPYGDKFLSLLVYIREDTLIIYSFHTPPPWKQNDIASSWFDEFGTESIWCDDFVSLYLTWPNCRGRVHSISIGNNFPPEIFRQDILATFSASLYTLGQAMQ